MLFVTEMNYFDRGGTKLGARTKVMFEMCKWYPKAAADVLITAVLCADAVVQSPSPCGRLNTVLHCCVQTVWTDRTRPVVSAQLTNSN
jgi:gamma-glutamyl phosphate reductase